MTPMPRNDLEPALRRSLEHYAVEAPPPEGLQAIPDAWVRPSGVTRYAGYVLAPLAVAVLAASTTWVALAYFSGPLSDPVAPGTSAAPALSNTPSEPAEFTSPPPPDSPPEVTIGGVAGDPVAWCYGNACVDGVYVGPVDELPAVVALGPVDATVGFDLTAARVFAADGTYADVPLSGMEIGLLPAGQWERLQLSVTFGAGSDGTYLWRIALAP